MKKYSLDVEKISCHTVPLWGGDISRCLLVPTWKIWECTVDNIDSYKSGALGQQTSNTPIWNVVSHPLHGYCLQLPSDSYCFFIDSKSFCE